MALYRIKAAYYREGVLYGAGSVVDFSAAQKPPPGAELVEGQTAAPGSWAPPASTEPGAKRKRPSDTEAL